MAATLVSNNLTICINGAFSVSGSSPGSSTGLFAPAGTGRYYLMNITYIVNSGTVPGLEIGGNYIGVAGFVGTLTGVVCGPGQQVAAVGSGAGANATYSIQAVEFANTP